MQPTSKDKARYRWQKGYTKGRKDKLGNPIDFKLTFQEWWDWWQATGHYHERGCRTGQYCMARFNDLGHYELGNIFCTLTTDNTSAGSKGRKHTASAKAKIGASSSKRVWSEERKAASRGKKMPAGTSQKAWATRRANLLRCNQSPSTKC